MTELLIQPISISPLHFVNIYDTLNENLQNQVAQELINKKDYANILALATHNTNEEIKNQIVKIISESNNPKYILSLMRQPGFLFTKHYDILIRALNKTQNAKYIYEWIHYSSIPEKLQYNEIMKESIVNASNPNYVYLFALNDYYGSDINALENIVIHGNAQTIYKFARNIKNADILKLEDALIETNNILYMFKFLKFITEANKEKLKLALSTALKTVNFDVEQLLDIQDEVEENQKSQEAYHRYLYQKKFY